MKKKLIIGIVGIYVVACILVVCFYLYPHYKYRAMDEWYEDEVEAFAITYVKQIETSNKEPFCASVKYSGIDKNIVQSNRETDNKIYPFSNVEAHIIVDDREYVLQISKDSNGLLYVVDYEVKKSTKWYL